MKRLKRCSSIPILRISEEIASQLRPGSRLAHRIACSLVTGCSEIQENSSAQLVPMSPVSLTLVTGVVHA